MTAPTPLHACPRCGNSVSQRSGGVCLICLGQEALGFPPGSSRTDGGEIGLSPSEDQAVRAALEERAPPRQLGSYTIIEEIGRGGMGVVYAARHENLGQIVALKIIGAGRFATVEQEMRFVREAQTAARLRHPHIVSVRDAGHADGVAYFTMDLVPDGDLAQRMHGHPLTPRAAAVLLQKVAAAVGHAHREGVLHRDLKPSNILLEGDEPRVADFGLAAQLEPGADLTAGTRVLGTPAYLAPETQFGGSQAASPASDVYALGAILYEALTGRPPLVGGAGAVVNEPVAPRLLNPAVPRDLETVTLKCLERHPAARYVDAVALSEDLRRFLEGRPILARPISAAGRFLRWCRRRPSLAAIWFLTAALAIGFGIAAGAIAQARSRAVRAERDAREQLWSAKLAEAQARTLTRTMGRRAAALAALQRAAEIHPTLEVRNAAIAALALTDVEVTQRWPIAARGVIYATFDAQGHSVIVDDHSGHIAWRETGTDREIAELRDETGNPVHRIGLPALSADGKYAAMRGRDDVVYVWVRDGNHARLAWSCSNRPHPWPEPLELLGGDLAFSPDSRLLTIARPGGGFSVLQSAGGQEIGFWSDAYPSTRVRWSPDGHTLAATTGRPEAGGRLHLIDGASLTTRRVLELGGNAFDVSWSIDGRLIAASTDALEIRVFRTADGAPVQTLSVRDGNTARIAFLGEEDDLMTATIEQSFRWRSLHTGEEFLRITGVAAGGIFPTEDGQSFFTTDQTTHGLQFRAVRPTGVRIGRVDPDAYETAIAGTGSLAFSPDGQWLSATAIGELAILRATDGAHVSRWQAPFAQEELTALFAHDGASLLVCGMQSGVRRIGFGPVTGTVAAEDDHVIDPESGFYLRDMSDNGNRAVLVAQQAGRVKILEKTAGDWRVLTTWPAPGAYGAAFGPGGTQLLLNHDNGAPGAADATLRLWDVASGQVLTQLTAPVSADVDWCERAGIVLTSNGADLSLLWNARDWTRGAAVPETARGNATSFAIAPDGKIAAIGTNTGAYLIDTSNGRTLAVLTAAVPLGFCSAAAFSPDSHRLAVLNGDAVIFLWDLAELRAGLRKLQLDW